MKRLLGQDRLWPASRAPFAPMLADDLFIWVALGVVIGGRLGYVLLYDAAPFLQHPLEILADLDGRHGVPWRHGRHHRWPCGCSPAVRGVKPETVMDLVAAAVPIGLFFGRIANFINAEVVGAVSNVPWAMVFPGYGC